MRRELVHNKISSSRDNAEPRLTGIPKLRERPAGQGKKKNTSLFWYAIGAGFVFGTIGSALGLAISPWAAGSDNDLSISILGAALGCLVGIVWLGRKFDG